MGLGGGCCCCCWAAPPAALLKKLVKLPPLLPKKPPLRLQHDSSQTDGYESLMSICLMLSYIATMMQTSRLMLLVVLSAE